MRLIEPTNDASRAPVRRNCARTAASEKDLLRREYRLKRDTLPDRTARSMQTCERVATLPAYQQARALHSYIAMRSELDTRPLLVHAFAQGKRVIVPVVQRGTRILSHSWLLSTADDELESGVFGTLQPRVLRMARPGDWDLMLVPLLAFDRLGYRLGYGGGFYDRLIDATPAVTVGVAFAAQEIARVPREPHDLALDWIVTEQEIIQVTSC